MNCPSNAMIEPDNRSAFFNDDRKPAVLNRSGEKARSGIRILVCVDDTPASSSVVLHAIAVGDGLSLPLTLARVVETAPGSGRPPDPIEWQIQQDEHRKQLRQIAAFPPDDPAPIETVLLTGSAADRLSDWAVEHRAPLLALATHGRASKHVGLGATVQNILERGSTSLLLVPPEPTPAREKIIYRKLLVPLDGSCRAESVLPLASRIARKHGAEIVLAHVVPKATLVAGRVQLESELCGKLEAYNQRRAREYLEDLRAKLRADGVRVSTIVAPNGDARTELRLLAKQQQIDLIVLSSHGQSGLMEMPCGSVTEYLAAHAPAPMLIVRPGFTHGFSALEARPMPVLQVQPLAN